VRVLLDDGRLMRLNYAAANGQPYYAVGRWLIDRNIVPKEEMSMDRIREWMERNPKEGEELRRRNKSYVFFRETNLPVNEEPIGAQGISLTPGRSIAVDRKLHTYGTPFFISAYLPIQGLTPDTWFRRLMIAQDTGGAIVGPARADLYFGAGDEAASIAGRLRHNARFVMLMPKPLVPAGDDDEIPLPLPRPAMLVSDDKPADVAPVAVAATPAPSAEPVQKPAEPVVAKPEVVQPKVNSTPEPKPVAVPTAKPANKPAEKVAAKTPEPELKNATAAAPKADLAPEKKSKKKTEKHEASAKAAPSKVETWEARVMPVIPAETPAKTQKSKKKE